MRARIEAGDIKGSAICLGDLARRTVAREGLSVVVDRWITEKGSKTLYLNFATNKGSLLRVGRKPIQFFPYHTFAQHSAKGQMRMSGEHGVTVTDYLDNKICVTVDVRVLCHVSDLSAGSHPVQQPALHASCRA